MELHALTDDAYKKAKTYVDDAADKEKREKIMAYAAEQAAVLGDAGTKVINSSAFFDPKWLNKSTTVKNYQDAVNAIIGRAAADLSAIQSAGGENTQILLARYFDDLSMEGVKEFQKTIMGGSIAIDDSAVVSAHNAIGYKVLKITATEDQMAAIMDQLAIMGAEVEVIEDGMPQPLEELEKPYFDSFVAFDIETSGSNGAANGDTEAKITEIGAVRVVNGEIVERFDELANPGRKIVPRIEKLTHITNEMVADKPPVDEVIRRFREFVAQDILVGHNIKSSDLRYIVKAADQAGVHFDGAFFDTYLYAKKFMEDKKWKNVKLEYLSEQFGISQPDAHRAWCDAEANAQVYFKLKEL